MITRFVVNSVQGLLASARAALSGLACRTETFVNEHAGVPARAPAVRARNPSAPILRRNRMARTITAGWVAAGGGGVVFSSQVFAAGPQGAPPQAAGPAPQKPGGGGPPPP